MGQKPNTSGSGGSHKPQDRHTHEFLGSTRFAEECEDRHNHRFAGVSGPPIYRSDGTHIHEFKSNTDFVDGHYHQMDGRTGPGIMVGEGRHVHFAEDTTTFEDGHVHTLVFATLIEDPPGEEENDR